MQRCQTFLTCLPASQMEALEHVLLTWLLFPNISTFGSWAQKPEGSKEEGATLQPITAGTRMKRVAVRSGQDVLSLALPDGQALKASGCSDFSAERHAFPA